MYSVDHHTFRTSDKSLPSIQSIFFWLRVPQGQYPRPELAPPERSPLQALAPAVPSLWMSRYGTDPPTTVSVSGAHPPPTRPSIFHSPPHPTPTRWATQLSGGMGWVAPPSQLVRTLVPPLQSALQRFKTGAAPLKTFRL